MRLAISNITQQEVVRELIADFGYPFFLSFMQKLQEELFSETNISRSETDNIQYISLADLVEQGLIIKGGLNGIAYQLLKKEFLQKAESSQQINLVFPCRNSSSLITKSLEFLLAEIRKSKDIDFNVVFQVNNTKDDTIKKIVDILAFYESFLSRTNFYILETDPELVLSLPGSLNIGHYFLRTLQSNSYQNSYFSFWDDELNDSIPTIQSIFKDPNLNLRP